MKKPFLSLVLFSCTALASVDAADVSAKVLRRAMVPMPVMQDFKANISGLVTTQAPKTSGVHYEFIEIESVATWNKNADDYKQQRMDLTITQAGKPVAIVGEPNGLGAFAANSIIDTIYLDKPSGTKEKTASERRSVLCLVADKVPVEVAANGVKLAVPEATQGAFSLPPCPRVDARIESSSVVDHIVGTMTLASTPELKAKRIFAVPGAKLRKVRIKYKLSKSVDKSIREVIIRPAFFALLATDGTIHRPMARLDEAQGLDNPIHANGPDYITRRNDDSWPSDGIYSMDLVFINSKGLAGAKPIFLPSLATPQ